LTGRAPVSISPADFSVTSAPKASASILAGQVEVHDRDRQRVLLHRQGLVRQCLDLHRPVGQFGVLVNDDPCQRVFPHDELPAQVAEADGLLTHDLTPCLFERLG
jgi:hypothetical protein